MKRRHRRIIFIGASLAALGLATAFDLKLILVDVTNLGPVREQLGEWKGKVSVVLNPGVRPGWRNSRPSTPSITR